MKSKAFLRKKEVRRFPFRYIESVKSRDGRMLRSNNEMHETFREHFCDLIASCPDLPVQEFRSYLADFSRLSEVEVEAGQLQQITVLYNQSSINHNSNTFTI